MGRTYLWIISTMFIGAFFIFLPQPSLAVGEDIWVVSTGAESTFHTLLDDDYNVTTKTVDEIVASGISSDIELLIYPGGLQPIVQSQDSALVTVVQDYVNQGGRYFGSCGGSIPGAQDLSWDYGSLDMIGLVQVQAIDRLSWTSTVSYTDGFTFNSNTINGDYAGETHWLSYTGGPAFDVVVGYEDEVEVLATYAADFDPAEAPTYYEVKDKAAIVAADYGEGKVILSAPHPESDEDTKFLFSNYIEDLLPEEVVDAPDEEEEEEDEEIIEDDNNDEVPEYVVAKVKNVRSPKAKRLKKKAYIKWNKVAGVDGYNLRLLQWNKKTKTYKKKRTIKKNSNKVNKWVKKLKPGTKYKIRVRAKIEVNGIIQKGPWSVGKIFKTKSN